MRALDTSIFSLVTQSNLHALVHMGAQRWSETIMASSASRRDKFVSAELPYAEKV
jgi:hypothetical protein